MVSLENGIGTTGGFTCGRAFVMGHQRLSGLGYCFSASLPPLLAAAAIEALHLIDDNKNLVGRLGQISKRIHDTIEASLQHTEFVLQGAPHSPLKLIHCKEEDSEKRLNQLVEKFMGNGIVVTRSRFLDQSETFAVPKGIKLTCNAGWTDDELNHVLSSIKSTFV
ncbi:unnamed protein product [Bursaphelenchus xylophilus]|uniref:Serine palmitoyltransferase 1 n=1 Tax=Bursaphelenchus xylophilus TaxID=6326 RepID=A0A7I8WWM5_BURXY|nr:unnamed protein product [Bursaphelenchus xylophilus]CAG9099089.1 unnamed protein product [Bursaphelenchus xylophilus]